MKILAAESWSRSARRVLKINRGFFLVFTLVALTSIPHPTASANSSVSGQIPGTVMDHTGATVDGAAVVLFDAAGLEAERSLTDQRGRFTIGKVRPADYVVSVQKIGFQEVRRVLHVASGESLQLQFQLNVASIFETVTVTPGRGLPQEVFQVPQSPVVVTEEEIARRHAIFDKNYRTMGSGIDGPGTNAAVRYSFSF